MKSFNQLHKDYQRKVKELQKKCSHKKSRWMLSAWATCHFDDFIVRSCDFCHKTLEQKIPTTEERAHLIGPKPELLKELNTGL